MPLFSERYNYVKPSDALLLSYLDNAVVTACCRHHGIAFGDRVGQRFLHINVFTGSTSIDSHQAVPMVGRSDNHGVDVGVFEEFAIVGI